MERKGRKRRGSYKQGEVEGTGRVERREMGRVDGGVGGVERREGARNMKERGA